MKTLQNEKVVCRHCNTHIANKHVQSKKGYPNFEDNNLFVPTKNGMMTKTKVRGTSYSERFGDMERVIGFVLETQFQCKHCQKYTTVKTTDEA